MRTIKDLPLKVIEEIFHCIPKKDLYSSCLFVSKSWFKVAGSIYYKTVQLTPKVIRYLNEKLVVNNNASDTNFRTLPFTKTLCIYSGGYTDSLSTFIDPQIFSFILSLFPNLKVLDLGDYGTHRLYNIKLLLEHCNPKSILPCLEKIIVGHDDTIREDLYFAVQYKFRRTLKHVHLVYNFESQYVFQKSIFTMLSDFKELEELVFINNKLSQLTVFTILTTCSNLSSLTFQTKFDVAEEDERGYLERLLDQVDLSESTPSTYFKNLKQLIITAPYFTLSFVNYFINNCPESLRQFEITFTDEDFYNWIDDMSLDTVLKLARRMSKIPKAKIASDQSVRCTKRNGVPKDETKINVFHHVLAALKGQERRFSKCCGLYQDTTYPGVSLLCDETTDYMGYDYFVDHEDYGIDARDKGEDLVRYKQLPLPDLTLPVGPSTTTEIRFMIQVAYFIRLPRVQLEHVKKYFTHLICFEATYLVPTCKMIATQRDVNTKSRLEDMVSCELKGAQLSQEILDDLVSYFPKLEFLKFEIANYYQPYRKQKDFVHVNLSKFNSLKAFILELQDMVYLQNHHHIFFDVSFTDRKESPAFFTLCGWRMDDPDHNSASFGQFQQVNIDMINRYWDDPQAGVFIVTIELPVVEESFKLIYSRHDTQIGIVTLTREVLSLDKLSLS